MTIIERFIEVEAPASTAYNIWTQYELFPRFMEGVEKVRQTAPRQLHWRANIWGKTEEWDAEITEQIPDERIAWRSAGGFSNASLVTFHRLSDDRSRVMLQMEYKLEHVVAKVADALDVLSHRVEADLMRFKVFAERHSDRIRRLRGAIPPAKENPRQRERCETRESEADGGRVIPIRVDRTR